MAQQIINVDDTATAMMLAKLEQNAGGALVVHLNDETGVVDKTWQEIHDALADGKTVTFFHWNDGDEVGQNQIFAAGAYGGDEHQGYYWARLFDFDAKKYVEGVALGKDGYPQFNL